MTAAATIRTMVVEDLPAVYRLGTRSWDLLDKPYNYWSIREVADHVEGEPELCFVAESGGRIVGFALGASSYEAMQESAHLEWVAVEPDHRRGGLAQRLVESFVEAVRSLGRTEVVADVSSANEASRAFFRRVGFDEGVSVTFFTRRLD